MSGINPGDRKNIDHKYLVEAIDLLLEFGIKLTQVVWRKLLPDEAAEAADCLSETGYSLIVKKRYRPASRILKFGLFEQKVTADEATRKRMVVNYANAVKLGGNKEEALKVLDNEDWSATSAIYQVCVMAVRDDLEGVISLMKEPKNAELPNAQDFREWPVFEPLRSRPEFIDAFEKTFGQPLIERIDRSSSAGSSDATATSD